MRRWWLVVASIIVLALPAVYYINLPSASDDLELAIIKVGFSPIKPPQGGRITGSIYHTDVDGTILRPVCTASTSLVEPFVRQVPVPGSIESKLRSARLGIEARIIEALDLKYGEDKVEKVEISFSDVSMLQIDGTGLLTVESRLVEQEHCDKTIESWFDDRGLICQVQSTLLATVDFSATTKQKTTIDNKQDMDKIREILTASSEVQNTTSGKVNFIGQAMLFGVRFKPKCLTRKTDTVPLLFPEEAIEKIAMKARLWARRNF